VWIIATLATSQNWLKKTLRERERERETHTHTHTHTQRDREEREEEAEEIVIRWDMKKPKTKL
jgi:hypothetical protein